MNWNVGSLLRWVFDIVAFAVAVATSVASYFKIERVKTAEKRTRQSLLNRMASQQFDALASRTESLTLSVRSKDWKRSAQEAVGLKAELASASGSWLSLLKPNERDKLEVTIEKTDALLQALPLEQCELGPEQVQAMTAQCHFLLQVMNEIAGRLKYLDDPRSAK